MQTYCNRCADARVRICRTPRIHVKSDAYCLGAQGEAMAYQAAMMAEQERLAKAQKRNFEMASGSVGGSDDERDTKEEAWASVFASTSAAGAESAEEQRRRKLQRKAVPAEAAAPATAAKAVAPEALMGVEEEDDDDEEEGGMPLAPPTVEAIQKGTKRGAAAAAPAAPPSKKGKSTHETAQPTAPPPKPAPLAAAKPAAPAPAPASKGGFVKIAGGVEYEDVQLGAMSGGVARNGQKVTVKYVGTLTNGKRFDAGDISFRLGAGEVIKGWDLGVAGMRVGGKRKLRIPPDAAYGKRGAPPTIPPNATLLFDVELKRC